MEAFYQGNILRRQFAIEPTPSIFERGYRLEMIWIYAAPDATKMIKEKAIRNWTKTLLIVKAMGLQMARIDGDLAVAVIAQCKLPNPARRLVAAVLDKVSLPFSRVMVMDEPHGVILEDAESEVALRGDRCFLAAAAEAQAGWIGRWNFYAGWQIHVPLQVDGSGNPGGTRRLTSVSKADAQPAFADVEIRLAHA